MTWAGSYCAEKSKPSASLRKWPSGFATISSGGPASTISPLSKTCTACASLIVLRRCATTRHASKSSRDSRSSARLARIVRSVRLSSADVASSRQRSAGLRSSARAMQMRCFCPDETRMPPTPMAVAGPSASDSTNSSRQHSLMTRSTSKSSAWRAYAMFSRSVPVRSGGSAGTSATCSKSTCGSMSLVECPKRVVSPLASGRRRITAALTKVVLPEPLVPTTPAFCPMRTSIPTFRSTSTPGREGYMKLTFSAWKTTSPCIGSSLGANPPEEGGLRRRRSRLRTTSSRASPVAAAAYISMTVVVTAVAAAVIRCCSCVKARKSTLVSHSNQPYTNTATRTACWKMIPATWLNAIGLAVSHWCTSIPSETRSYISLS
mmetsp:Transcript_17714/g.57951  ORF Transcript_17714/g.57951 Transcript_17714/m.57951 type:complete len:377 (+) Transcript_17714:1508-2638(+)